MSRDGRRILVHLPSPMGDAILCTPALRAIRTHFAQDRICFLANKTVHAVLSPCPFTDEWIDFRKGNMLAMAAQLRRHGFTHALLMPNSLRSALMVFLAGVPRRIGYSRQGRGVLLTERLYPLRLPGGKRRPVSMVDYYLAVAERVGAEAAGRDLELHVDPAEAEALRQALPEAFPSDGPLVVLVPGGAFGPSKCWPPERFAETADRLVETHGATIVVSVATNPFEKEIAEQIRQAARHPLVSLADRPMNLGRLKALFARADLVIANDTGPRHIAIALRRRVITLFGPNDPAWTQTGYMGEVQIVGQAPCAPCQKPRCFQSTHICMQDIASARVLAAAETLLKPAHQRGSSSVVD